MYQYQTQHITNTETRLIRRVSLFPNMIDKALTSILINVIKKIYFSCTV